ncbi:hypothetical protein [Nonomuraea sp. NPDC050202]|uniref:hypothetical protein n=1 Tax=Nonomuraea sp. NPDC050202 TaxID=3155035 RepID=UPI00340415EE
MSSALAALRRAATRRSRSPARVAGTTWLGSTPCSGIAVMSGRKRATCGGTAAMATGSPVAISSSLSSTDWMTGPSGAGLPSGLGPPGPTEQAPAGARLHAVAEEGVPVRDLAEITGRHLGLPVTSIPMAEAGEHFGRLGRSSRGTRAHQ